jgi:hypothetical protein
MAGIYADYLDENGQWTADTFNSALEKSGYVVDLGQIADWMKPQLAKFIKAGRLVKYRGYWNTGHAAFGMGPLKTIYAYPEVAESAADILASMGKVAIGSAQVSA